MYHWYKFLTYLFYPFAKIFLLIRKIKKKEHINRYKEKISIIKKQRGDGCLVWFHAASVGECLSILPLIQELSKNAKVNKILVTSVTLSSAKVLQNKMEHNKKIVHQFLPLDIPNYVNKFLNHWSPDLSIFINSEILPNLIFQKKKKKIPLLLINGRITKKSFYRWKYLNSFAREIFKKFDLCLSSSKESENYLKILGAKNVKNLGNLKFSGLGRKLNDKLNSNFLNKLENRKIWCAASTHFSEEIFCGKVHLSLNKHYKNALLIIIPRHINRIAEIKKDLSNLNLNVILYTDISQINNETDVLLVDTYGDAPKFFEISKNVFLGGSLISHGGQNPIEASRLGCKIFHGPHINNFSEIYALLKSLMVSNEVNSQNELCQALVNDFENKNQETSQIINKINSHGEAVLNNVMKEIKVYINI